LINLNLCTYNHPFFSAHIKVIVVCTCVYFITAVSVASNDLISLPHCSIVLCSTVLPFNIIHACYISNNTAHTYHWLVNQTLLADSQFLMLCFPARQSRRPMLKSNLQRGSCLRNNLLMRRFVLFVSTDHIFFPPVLYTAQSDTRPAFPHITNVSTDFLLTMLGNLCSSRAFPIGSNNLRWICSWDLSGTQHRRPDHRPW